jgi:hypothetical protein
MLPFAGYEIEQMLTSLTSIYVSTTKVDTELHGRKKEERNNEVKNV